MTVVVGGGVVGDWCGGGGECDDGAGSIIGSGGCADSEQRAQKIYVQPRRRQIYRPAVKYCPHTVRVEKNTVYRHVHTTSTGNAEICPYFFVFFIRVWKISISPAERALYTDIARRSLRPIPCVGGRLRLIQTRYDVFVRRPLTLLINN